MDLDHDLSDGGGVGIADLGTVGVGRQEDGEPTRQLVKRRERGRIRRLLPELDIVGEGSIRLQLATVHPVDDLAALDRVLDVDVLLVTLKAGSGTVDRLVGLDRSVPLGAVDMVVAERGLRSEALEPLHGAIPNAVMPQQWHPGAGIGEGSVEHDSGVGYRASGGGQDLILGIGGPLGFVGIAYWIGG